MVLAEAYANGIPGMEMLEDDMSRGIVMAAVVKQAVKDSEERNERLADMITAKIVKAWNDGQRKQKKPKKGK